MYHCVVVGCAVGGASADVNLYDLRMVTDIASSRIVQMYRPRGLSSESAVSVSGIDLSKDQKELLVSYENEQIYTFSIFPNAKSASGPTVDEISQRAESYEADGTAQPEIAAYGAHLNRFTFLKVCSSCWIECWFVFAKWSCWYWMSHLRFVALLFDTLHSISLTACVQLHRLVLRCPSLLVSSGQNAKYAGPSDEYICTGSDTGHAWIYEKATGAVVSFLNADSSTCNGILPHPTLPFFATYGIDSTAKLWRATTPVDNSVDDSPLGRARFHHRQKYEQSPLVKSWSSVRARLATMEEFDEHILLPDEIPDDSAEGVGGPSGIFFRRRSLRRTTGTKIGNDLHNLRKTLQQNLFDCIDVQEATDDEPIKSSMDDLRTRISLIRLRHQADRQGLLSNRTIPWQFHPREAYVGEQLCIPHAGDTNGTSTEFHYGDASDLVPDQPCDWLPYDPQMVSTPRWFDLHSHDNRPALDAESADAVNNQSNDDNGADADAVLTEKPATSPLVSPMPTPSRTDGSPGQPSTLNVSDSPPTFPTQRRARFVSADTQAESPDGGDELRGESPQSLQDGKVDDKGNGTAGICPAEPASVSDAPDTMCKAESTAPRASQPSVNREYASSVLLEIVTLLKDAGNAALKAGLPALAARRYDQALLYCADALMSSAQSSTSTSFAFAPSSADDATCTWSPILQRLVAIRLNLALVLLKPTLRDPKKSSEQAMIAVVELKPFGTENGTVRMGENFELVHHDNEPESTFREAREFMAKAFFRLGAAQSEMAEYQEAAKSYASSIKLAQSVDAQKKPDQVVLRRLADAKRESAKQMKRQRKKFKGMFQHSP